MKKLLVIVAVLSLIAGTAYAADLNEGLTKQVYAQTKGRSVVSDGSVMLRVYYTGTSNAQIGVSSNSINLYVNGASTTVPYTSYATIGNIVDYINNQTDWESVVGPDARRGEQIGNLCNYLETATAVPGTSKQDAYSVYRDSSNSRKLSVGVEATTGKTNRLKSITSKYATAYSGSNATTVYVYDGENVIYRKDISPLSYCSATSKDASPSTISFSDSGEKGLSASQGNSLVVVVSGDTAVCISAPNTTDKLSDHNISITYDQF